MAKLTFVLLVTIVVLPTARAWAGCETDLQCKGDRICHEGACIFAADTAASPTPDSASAPAPAFMPPRQPTKAPDAGWSGGARILGLVTGGAMAVGTIATGIFAAEDDTDPSLVVGGITTLLGGVCIPIVAAGASSARNHPAVKGWPGMRIAGWIAYGLFMLDAVALLGLGAGDVDVPAGAVVSVGTLGLIAAGAHTADAWVSHAQAGDAIRAHSQQAASAPPARHAAGSSILPSVTWAQRAGPHAPTTPLIGVTVRH